MGANAVDASVAIVFCLGLTIPQSTGIGGGFFMVIHNQCALSIHQLSNTNAHISMN